MSIEVRTVSALADLAGLDLMLGGIWHDEPVPLLGMELLRALVKGGGYVAAAYDGAEPVGATVGFFGPPDEGELHSHVTGVVPGAAGRGVGYALKQHQRRWARERGAVAITWTFDPLVARNAHFNLAKLGAEPVEYLPDFYGPMHDRLNGDAPSDRLLVRWDVTGGTPLVADPAGAVVALDRSGHREPAVRSLVEDGGPHAEEKVLVAVPEDIETLRTKDPVAAGQWRLAVREVLVDLIGEGATFVGFDRTAGYVLRRPR